MRVSWAPSLLLWTAEPLLRSWTLAGALSHTNPPQIKEHIFQCSVSCGTAQAAAAPEWSQSALVWAQERNSTPVEAAWSNYYTNKPYLRKKPQQLAFIKAEHHYLCRHSQLCRYWGLEEPPISLHLSANTQPPILREHSPLLACCEFSIIITLKFRLKWLTSAGSSVRNSEYAVPWRKVVQHKRVCAQSQSCLQSWSLRTGKKSHQVLPLFRKFLQVLFNSTIQRIESFNIQHVKHLSLKGFIKETTPR